MSALRTILRQCDFRLLACQFAREPQRESSTRAMVNRINRHVYGRMYPVHLVLSNGATVRIRYKEPRCLIQLPLDLEECGEEERTRRLQRRKPKARLALQQDVDFEDSLDPEAYDFLWNKTNQKPTPTNS